MNVWPNRPIIYEIHTWVWLAGLSRSTGRRITLANVPSQVWDAIAGWGVDAVWLMGVWERSPAGARIARETPALQAEYRRALPDFVAADVVGSPYAVHRYVVDEHLGGAKGLAAARKALADRGIRLILDFVPNHVATDHPWVSEHPEYFIHGDAGDLARAPQEFFAAPKGVFACGRDPFFPPWTDSAQLNAFAPGVRQAAVDTLRTIAQQCDGVRCDMAILLITEVFERTWKERGGPRPREQFWKEVIARVRAYHPGFCFIAEAYWDLEWELQQQGFDFCYDKRLYDRLIHETAQTVRLHLSADMTYQERLVRFLENHDEPRAAGMFSPQKLRASALAVATLPGARLFYDGQFEGRKVKLPIQLGRRPDEPLDRDLEAFYRKLLMAVRRPAFREGRWRLCEVRGWPDNSSYLNLVAWCWRHGDERHLVVVNLSEHRGQGRVELPWDDLDGRSWLLADALSGDVFARDGNEMHSPGL
jgi:glycosidase